MLAKILKNARWYYWGWGQHLCRSLPLSLLGSSKQPQFLISWADQTHRSCTWLISSEISLAKGERPNQFVEPSEKGPKTRAQTKKKKQLLPFICQHNKYLWNKGKEGWTSQSIHQASGLDIYTVWTHILLPIAEPQFYVCVYQHSMHCYEDGWYLRNIS